MKLKACPFCGGEALEHSGNIDASLRGIFSISCGDCGCGTADEYSKDNATKAWNKRA